MNKPLRRTVRVRMAPLNLDLQVICDKCNTSRAHGNHKACSKARQTENAHRWRGC
jgi:hypothetical protein